MKTVLAENISVLSHVRAFANNANEKLFIFWLLFFLNIKVIESNVLELIIAVGFAVNTFDNTNDSAS